MSTFGSTVEVASFPDHKGGGETLLSVYRQQQGKNWDGFQYGFEQVFITSLGNDPVQEATSD